MKKVGLFFGSFNPIHIGHLILANYLAENSSLDEVWFVITPQSPFKKNETLLEDHHRYQLVLEAISEYPKLKASTVEFKLPQPNYTINTLVVLEEQYPEISFSLLMGTDNLAHFHKWKNASEILQRHEIYAYPRMGHSSIPEAYQGNKKVHLLEAPVIEISASALRKDHASGKNIRPYLPESVWKYIDEMNFYRP